MSTRPLSPEELDEIENLATECEDPARLRRLLAAHVRLRAFASFCRRHASGLTRSVVIDLQRNVPNRNTGPEWAAATGSRPADDPRFAGTSPRLI
jgi:hypothetical protein